MATKAEAIAGGYFYVCLGCHSAYKKIPQEWYEDGHGGRWLDMCSCGSDLFTDLRTDGPATKDGHK